MPKLALSYRTIERLKAPEKTTDYYDTAPPHVALRVTPSGTKSFVAFYRLAGDKRVRRKTLGRFPQLTLAEARKQTSTLKDAAKHGSNPAGSRPESATLTVSELIERFVDQYLKQQSSRPHDMERRIRRFTEPLSNTKITEVKRNDIIAQQTRLQQEGLRTGNNRAFSYTRSMFSWAVERGYLTENPCHSVRLLNKEKPRDRVLSDYELKAICHAVCQLGVPHREIFYLQLLTAQRGGEIRQLRWQWLDFNSKAITIPAAFYKTRKPHVVPMSGPVETILSGVPRISDELVLPSPRTGRAVPAFSSKQKAKIDQKSGVTDWTMHDLRTTAATNLAWLGFGFIVDRVLGHDRPGVTARYDRFTYFNEKRDALEGWAAHVLNTVPWPFE